MKKDFADSRLRWFIGDIRDRDRLMRAFHGVDYVVHAAALKQVDTAEYNPFEYVKTNVLGSQNVIDAAIDAGVKKVVALSTDKASSPDQPLRRDQAHRRQALHRGQQLQRRRAAPTSPSCATATSWAAAARSSRSSGSSPPRASRCPSPTARMTRFWITLPQAVQFVVDSFDRMQGGELYVPRIPSMRITDLIEAMAPG